MKRKVIFGLLMLLAVFAYRIIPTDEPQVSTDSEVQVPIEDTEEEITPLKEQAKVDQLLSFARGYLGTPHQYGAQSKTGIDCSGLVHLSFQSLGMDFPRSSAAMNTVGHKVDLEELKAGDVVLFTHPSGSKITHSGIVTKFNAADDITFIHTSTSKGVIEESMSSKYWSTNFVMARRVL